jgi:hypothetical protein
MSASIRQQGSCSQHPSGFLVVLQVFDSILHWLFGFIQLTEEEQRDSGVYIGRQRYE